MGKGEEKVQVTWLDVEQELQTCSFPDTGQDAVLFGAGFGAGIAAPLLLQEGLHITACWDNDCKKKNLLP